MNWKALKKTITPSKDFFIVLGALLGIFLVATLFIGGLSLGVALVLEYLLGETLANYVLLGGFGAWSLWELVISPLRQRYKRISQGQK